jgi:hypothetical protein
MIAMILRLIAVFVAAVGAFFIAGGFQSVMTSWADCGQPCWTWVPVEGLAIKDWNCISSSAVIAAGVFFIGLASVLWMQRN